MKKLLLALLFFAFQAQAISIQPFLDMKEPVAFSATTTSTQALTYNTYRRYLIIQNRGAASIYVKFGAVHSGTEGLEIVGGGNYEMLTPPFNSVWIVAASGTQSVVLYEGR